MKKILAIILLICFNSYAQKTKTHQYVKQKDTAFKTAVISQKIPKIDTVHVANFDSASLKRMEENLKNAIINKESDGWFVKYLYPVLLLLAGAAIPLFWENRAEKKRIRKVGERWTSEIRFLETPIKNQVEEIQKYLAIHNQQNLVFPGFQMFEGLDCEIFMSLDKSDLLKFIEQHTKKNYPEAVVLSNKINGFINIVKSSNKNLRWKFTEYSDGVSKYITEVTKNLTLLSRAFGNYCVELEQELGTDPIHDERYIAIRNLFDAEIEPFRESGNFELYRLHDNFFIPFNNILAQLRHDSRTNKMAEYVGYCVDAIKGMKMEKQYLKENFETIEGRYQDNLAELPTIVGIIEERKA